MSAIVIDGGIIHYEVIGRGRPLIFIHGWLGSWRYWMGSMEELSPYFRTYALDLWGFGDSDKSYERFRVIDYINLLEAFMEEMGIRQAPLVGHSLGAVIAVRFAARNPQKVEKLVAVSLPIIGAALNSRFIRSNNVLGLIPPEYAEVMREARKASAKALEVSAKSVIELDLRLDLLRIQAPTLIIYGDRDSVVDTNHIKAFKDLKSSIRAMCLPGTRHFPMLEEASKFNRLLKEFLALGVEIDKLQIKEEWRRKMG
ncbi:MAG: hypothetical protein DRI61_05260 [Chloroflexi bacterium]|nr:MAG: hypothetical protein DRI61_05260 [Chloroflexota bacterium]